MARQLAGARALLESMTPEQRAKLAELSEALLEDDLAFAWSSRGWPPILARARRLPEQGPFELSLWARTSRARRRPAVRPRPTRAAPGRAPSPGALAEVDIDRARELLGAEDARSLEALGQLARQLRDSGLVEQKEGRMRLTPRGLRRIGDQALADLYTELSLYRSGQHPVGRPGTGHERAGETKAYEWGDPFNLSIERTVRNALGAARPGHTRPALPGRFRGRAHRSPDRARRRSSCSTCRFRCR